MSFGYARMRINIANKKEFRRFFPEVCMFADQVNKDWEPEDISYKMYENLVLPQGDEKNYGAVELKYMGKKFYYNLTVVGSDKVFFTYSVFLKDSVKNDGKNYKLLT